MCTYGLVTGSGSEKYLLRAGRSCQRERVSDHNKR